jgi:hypothetical protein
MENLVRRNIVISTDFPEAPVTDFDNLSKAVAQRQSRRAILRLLGSTVISAVFGRRSLSGQGTCPSPCDPSTQSCDPNEVVGDCQALINHIKNPGIFKADNTYERWAVAATTNNFYVLGCTVSGTSEPKPNGHVCVNATYSCNWTVDSTVKKLTWIPCPPACDPCVCTNQISIWQATIDAHEALHKADAQNVLATAKSTFSYDECGSTQQAAEDKIRKKISSDIETEQKRLRKADDKAIANRDAGKKGIIPDPDCAACAPCSSTTSRATLRECVICCGGTCCSVDQMCCKNVCVTPGTDIYNCGACSNICTADKPFCTKGVCVCPFGYGYEVCDGKCIPISTYQSDAQNCGSCGTVCTNGTTCTNGQCVCPSPLTTCPHNPEGPHYGSPPQPICVDPSDPHNCGCCNSDGFYCDCERAYAECANGNCKCCHGQCFFVWQSC